MTARQGPLSASGTVLARSRMGEGDLWLTLFLKGLGLVRASAPGAERGRVRFGGATEPFVWGSFRLHRGRGGGLYLNGADVADGMIPLRRRPEALLTAVRWSKSLTRRLLPEHPADDLLANLYWNMKLLCAAPPEVAEWRFLWRWLSLWGLAPDLGRCSRCGREPGLAAWTEDGLVCGQCDPAAPEGRPSFTVREREWLLRVGELDTEGAARLCRERELPPGLFALASRCAEGLLGSEK